MVGKLSQLSSANKGLLAIVGGTGAGQLVLLIAAPLLSRVYAPGVFGPFAVINAIALPLSTVAALRYELAIPIPPRERDARAIARLGLLCVLALSGLLMLAVLFAQRFLGSLVGLSGPDVHLLYWVPLIAGLMGTFVVLNQVAIRERMYSAIARRNLLQAVATSVFQVVAGLAGSGAHGLAAGMACGQAVGVGAMAFSLRPQLQAPVSRKRLRRRAKEFRSFPLLMAPSALINNMGIQVPVLLAASLFGRQEAGWLGMTQRILVLPVSLIGMAVAQVFLGEFAAAYREGRGGLKPLFKTASKRLALVGMVCASALIALGPLVFSLVLGSQWKNSGVYAQALALGMAAQMVAAPLSQVIIVTRRIKLQAVWDIARLIAVTLAMVLGARLTGSLEQTLWLLTAAWVMTYGALWLMAWRCVQNAR